MAQYFYDYINDLILAYYEFRNVATDINCACCADECAFPLHLVLGDANRSTNNFIKDCYRTYFIRSAAVCCNNDSIEKLRFYYHRMEILASQFKDESFLITESEKQVLGGSFRVYGDEIYARENTTNLIKITPSQYEDFPLSQRAIPYYYPEDPANADSLYKYWNFEKTARGNEAFNLSYNANLYNTYDKVVNTPLLYDIEKYNFFRIEGHIGLPYPNTLIRILGARQDYNLPFNVIAVAAEKFFPTDLDIQVIFSCLNGLLTDYYSRVIEFLCKAYICQRGLAQTGYSVGGSVRAAGATQAPDIDTEGFLKNFQFGTSVYKMGDFINYSNPDEGSMGKAYVNAITNGQFRNPVDITKLNCDTLDLSKSYYMGFNVLYAADKLFYTLLNTKPQELSSSKLKAQFKDFDMQFSELKTHITTNKLASGFSSALFDDCCDCLFCLFVDILWLLEQIIERIRQHESEMLFTNYFKKHPGLEHKAGVPKGGTFVLVYADSNNQKQVKERETVGGVALRKNPTPIIIADFYIPYLCCSDCAPMVYINQPPADYIRIQPEFLYDDTNNYPFDTNLSLTPDNFKDADSNPGGLNLLMDHGKFSLHPHTETLKTTLATHLKYNDITVPITIVVPDASFTITPTKNEDSNFHLKIDAKNKDATKYDWTVTDNNNSSVNLDTDSDKSYQIDFDTTPNESSFTISVFITYVINDNTSTDGKTAVVSLDMIKNELNKGNSSFEPTYQPNPA